MMIILEFSVTHSLESNHFSLDCLATLELQTATTTIKEKKFIPSWGKIKIDRWISVNTNFMLWTWNHDY
jgi:hypothetical protein